MCAFEYSLGESKGVREESKSLKSDEDEGHKGQYIIHSKTLGGGFCRVESMQGSNRGYG